MITRYRYSSPLGMFRIEQRAGSTGWRVVLGQRTLGQFVTPEDALAALVAGRFSDWPDPRDARVPERLEGWSARWDSGSRAA